MAYAAVLTIGSYLTGKWSRDDEVKSLCQTLELLDDECYRGIDRTLIHELDAQIRDAAWKLEDVLNLYQLSEGDDDVGGVQQDIDSFFETARKLAEEYERAIQNSLLALADEGEEEEDDDINLVPTVGVEVSELSEEITSELLDDDSDKVVFSIVGMAGIGKTHLARSIYHHPLIVRHFDLRLWVRMGPVHKYLKHILVDILSQMEGSQPPDLFREKDEDELIHLFNSLIRDRSLLIAFDDIWSRRVFTDCFKALSSLNRFKILLTTRILSLVKSSPLSGIRKYKVSFLSDEESWDLLRQRVFAERPFPAQLERAGRKIAEICEGLPLLILTVADILRCLDETEDCWNKVAEKKTTTLPDACDRIYKVLIPSYDYLLQIYKPNFLYMGVFRHGQKITNSKLAFMWYMELIQWDYQVLKVLKSNSVVIECKRGSKGIIKSCKLHTVYWYVCITEARKTKFFHVLIKLSDVFIESQPRRLSVQNNILFGLNEVRDSVAAVTSLTRSLLFTGQFHPYPVKICFNTMTMIQVLDALEIYFYEFPNEVTDLLLLRYLTLTHHGEVPSSISKLRYLCYLILRRNHNIIKVLHAVHSRTYLPKKIWGLENLIYLRMIGSNIPKPGHGVKLPNLLRLYMNADSCTESVLRSTPKLVKLAVSTELQPDGGHESLRCLEFTGVLNKLTSLKCVVENPHLSSQGVVLPNHLSNLPQNLAKLSLKGLGYPWRYISAVASLPNLKVLKLQCHAFQGEVWKIKDLEFLNLEFLLLQDMDVASVEAKGRGLEKLSHLVLLHCYKLKTIVFSEGATNLETLEVEECGPSIVELAQQMEYNPKHPYLRDVIINYSWNL